MKTLTKLLLLATITISNFGFQISNCYAQGWQQTNGPYGGTITSIINKGDTLFAAATYRVYASTDSGATWMPSDSGVPNTWISTLCVAGNNLLCGTQSGIYTSVDNGRHWSASLRGESVWVSALYSVNGVAFAGTLNGLYVSPDNGITWAARDSVQLSKAGGVFSFLQVGRYLIMGTGNLFYTSTDTGKTWVEQIGDLTGTTFCMIYVNGELIAGNSFKPIGISTDTGKTMTGITNFTPFEPEGVYSLLPVANKLLAAAENGIFTSTDSGASWQRTTLNVQFPSSGYPSDFLSLFSFGPKIFVGTGVGIYSSADSGSTWQFSSTGICAVKITSMATGPGCIYAGTASAGLYKSDDNGNAWTEIGGLSLSGNAINSIATVGHNVYADNDAGLYYTSDSGKHWIEADTGLGSAVHDVLAIYPSGNLLYACTAEGLFVSKNNGSLWTELNNPWSPGEALFSMVQTGDSIMVATELEGVYTSFDSGTIWQQVEIPQPGAAFGQFAMGKSIIALSYGPTGVITTTNFGIAWVPYAPTHDNAKAYSMVQRNDTFYCGTGDGVFGAYYTGNGLLWNPLGRGSLRDSIAVNLVISGSNIFMGSGTGSVWRYGLNSISNGGKQLEVGGWKLEVYPNPANDEITIATNNISPNTLYTITDITGRTILSGNLTGETNIINISQLVSGVYILQAGNENRQTFKMVKE